MRRCERSVLAYAWMMPVVQCLAHERLPPANNNSSGLSKREQQKIQDATRDLRWLTTPSQLVSCNPREGSVNVLGHWVNKSCQQPGRV
jgi:hypothetical protein